MSRPVYSKCVYSNAALLGSFEFWGATSEYALDIRDVEVRCGSTAGTIVILFDGLSVPVAQVTVLAGSYPGRWSGRQVINPGDTCSVTVFTGVATVRISGYTLTAP